MVVQYFAQHGDQPGETLPPLDVGRIKMILMLPRSPILRFKPIKCRISLDDRGLAFPSQP